MEFLHAVFPSLGVRADDCISTISGIRPVLSQGGRSPSEESREHLVWVNRGLVTVTGGKLTTFRRVALDTLKAARAFLPSVRIPARDDPGFLPNPGIPEEDSGVSRQAWKSLLGRYGMGAFEIVGNARPEDLDTIPGTRTLWAELPYTARNESIRHLSDLMLRRVRIGLLLPWGGKAYLRRIRGLLSPVLAWDRKRWSMEVDLYLNQWSRAYSLPDRHSVRGGGLRTAVNRVKGRFGRIFRRSFRDDAP